MIIGINLIALPSEQSSGAFRYIYMMFQIMGKYKLTNIEFVIYKQKQISRNYLDIPKNLKVTYVDVPNLGQGIKRIVFEQTMFYKYLLPCDVLYSYCTSIPLLVKCKKVFTLHDVYYLTTKQRYGWLQRKYLTLVTKIYCKLCDKICTVSEYSYAEILKLLKVPAEKLVLTYNFVLPSQINIPVSASFVDSFGNTVDLQIPYYLYIGNLQPGKNIAGMVNGFLEYAGYRSDIQLIICGKSSIYGDNIAQRISKRDNVHFIGYQSRNNVEVLLKHCKAVVLLSFCEGFGIPPLEGFVYGHPALVSSTTSLPEVVGNAGYKVSPTNITEIAAGFKILDEQLEDFIKFIPEQLSKFSPYSSVEAFFSALGITDFELVS